MMKHGKHTLVAVALVVALTGMVAAQVDDFRDIKYPKLPQFKFDKPEVYELKNGMTVLLLEDHELPLINVRAQIRTGSNYEPADKTGLAGLFGQVQREGGTSNMTGDAIDEFLGVRAATIETGVGGDSGFAGMNTLIEHFDDVFGLYADILRNPIFADDKLDVAKVQTNTGIARRNDNVGGIVGREFNRLIYGTDSALGRIVEYDTIANVTQDDLIAWHKKYYHPNNIYLGIVGDFNSKEMKEKINATFGDWAKGPEFDEDEVAYNEPEPGVYFIEKDDVTQANIRLGHLGMNMKNPDYHAVRVMNEVFGGGFASRLFSNVRSDKGLAYSVFGNIGSSFPREGVMQVGCSTKSETMAEAVDALKIEIDNIINNPPTDEEMKKAKESILNSFVFNYDSKSKILNQMMIYRWYGMPDFMETYRNKLEKVSKEDVARVAKKYIHPDKMVMLVVGKQADFDRPMSSFGNVKEIDISIPPPPDTLAKVERSEKALAAGSNLFAKAAKKISGGNGKVKSVTATYNMAINMGGQKMSLDTDIEVSMPNKLRQTVNTPGGKIVAVFNGAKGFREMGGQKQPLSSDETAEGLESLNRDLLVLATNTDSPDFEALAAGTEEIDGKNCDVVLVSFRGIESRLFIDSEGNIVKQVYNGKHPMQRTPGVMEIIFSEYTDVDGRMLPNKRVMSFDGQELMTMTMLEMKVNADVDEALFAVE